MRSSRAATSTSLASAARQLEYAGAQSTSPAEAFQKLQAIADDRQAEALRELEALLRPTSSGETMDRRARAPPFGTLAWLLRQTAEPDRSAASLLEAYRRRASYASATATVVWTEFAGFLTYLCAVLGILLCVVVVYGMLELPNFRSLYRSFGEGLPALTEAVFGAGAPFLTVLLLGVVALLVFLGWFVVCLRRQLRRFAPMPAGLLPFPLIGSVVRSYHDYLWLSYAGLLGATGMASAQALKLAATRLPSVECPDWNGSRADGRDGAGASAVAADLHVAARLGKLDDEANYQQEATADAFLEELARCRRRSRLILTIAIYWLVATYVAAMYLPIFSLGSVI